MLAAKGDAAKVALDAKLVTGLKSSLDVERRMVELVGAAIRRRRPKRRSKRTRATPASRTTPPRSRITCASCEAEKQARGAGKDKIGVIVASGEILDGTQPPGTVGGESTARC